MIAAVTADNAVGGTQEGECCAMASVRCGERSELSPPRSEQKLSSGVLERDADADSSVATDAGTNDCADALRLLLTQASPRCPDYIGSRRMDDSGVEHVAPALDVAFPVMHAYNLQLTDTIAVQLGEVDGAKQESRDLLRPSVRLLCSIGRSLVAEQYRRQMPERIRLRGVKAPKMSEEARREEREYLHQTLPPTGVAVASLRWRAKDLGGVYACTCVKAGCSFQPDSFLTLCRHVEEGHYRLRRLRQLPEKSWHCSRSPSVYYPINPANTRGLGSHGKNFYLCGSCGVYFSTVKATQAHYSRSHAERRFCSSETCVWVSCPFCEDSVERESSRLPVCRLQLRSRPMEVMWNEMRQCLQGDPARVTSAHVLASLLLFPNTQSPLCFTTSMARGIWWRSEGRCEGLKERVVNAVSAIRGVLRFTGKKRYRRVVEEAYDVQDLAAPGWPVPGEESGSECAIPVARKEARVFVQSLPSNVPTVEVEGASALPPTSSTVSGESCQPTRKVVIIGKRVVEGGDKCEDVSRLSNVEYMLAAVGLWLSLLDACVNWLCWCGGLVFRVLRVCCEEAAADEGGQSWRRWLVSGNAEEVPAKRLRCESATGVEVNAASGQEGGAVLAESHNGSVKGIATTDGGRNDCVAERRGCIATTQNGLSSARNSAVVGLGVKTQSDLVCSRPVPLAVVLSPNLPATMPVVPVVPVSAASIGLSTGLPRLAVKSPANNCSNQGKAGWFGTVETLPVINTQPKLSIKPLHSSCQPSSMPPCGTNQPVTQSTPNASSTLMHLELSKARPTSTWPHQSKLSGGYNLLLSRKSSDSSTTNTLLRIRQLPTVGGRSTPEAGACTTAPDALKSVSEVEEKVVARSAASTVPQLSTALTNAGWLGARKSPQPVSIMSAAKLSGSATSCAAHSTKSLTNGVASHLKCHETPCSNAESLGTVVGAASSASLKPLGTAESAAWLKELKIEPCCKTAYASLRSGTVTS
ncbi:zinc finger C2H2 type [Echinococcus multilocularis]|uniref:Zinc finger C2H2 type n=1 Tax=Echinococcus multilocularis TaxID=6211 RepID=A0A0S4MK38_ECHMU|nr:zinc finger C2H2 type [Echinococcus multilocularis]